jgi:hypothetical protein
MRRVQCTLALALALAFALALSAGCADVATTAPAALDEAACGIVVCVADQADDRGVAAVVIDVEGGKADAADEVLALLATLTADGELSETDVQALWEEAGAKRSDGELAVLRDAIAGAVTAYTVTPEAAQALAPFPEAPCSRRADSRCS